MTVPQLTLRQFALALTVLLLFAAVFVLPYRIAASPALADSYLFGYNNRVADVLIGLAALAAAFFLPRVPAMDHAPGKPLTRATLCKALALAFTIAFTLYLLTRRLDGFGESVYTVDRTRLLLEGRIPYRDFEFAYGALLIYLPALLTRALHLSVPDACGLFWIAFTLLGLWQLYTILRWSGASPARQRVAFLVLLPISLSAILADSTAYSLPRYLTAGFLIMALHRLLTRQAPSSLVPLLLPIPATAFVLAISPEMGLAFAFASAAYLLRFGSLRHRSRVTAYLTMLAGVAGVLLAASHLGVFHTLNSFSSGGYNFPLMPAPHILVFFLLLAIAAAYLGARLRAGQNTPLLALGFVFPAMLPAAFGRSDPAHVWFNGIPVLLIALLVCSARIQRLLAALVLLTFFVLPFARGIRTLVSTVTIVGLPLLVHGNPSDSRANTIALRIWGPEKTPIRLRQMFQVQPYRHTVDVPALFHLPPNTIFNAPFGFFAAHSGPYHDPSVDPGYFLSTGNVVKPDNVAQKVQELATHSARPLLLPPGAEHSCIVDEAGARAEIQAVFGYRYRAPAVHPGDLMEPLCAHIREHYFIARPATLERFNYALWLPRQ